VTLPNFLIIGAQKAGTSSLYYYLKQHPDVYMSPVKEAHFFDLAEGRDFRNTIPHITGIEDYRALFRGVSKEKAVGEASPSYIYVPGTPERIRDHIPAAKLIAILRNPVDRAYSAFLHTLRSGREPLTDFARALRAEETRIRDNWHPVFHYRERGFYHVQLKRYFDLFGRDRIRVYLHEDLKADPLGLLRDIFRFLGVDEAFAPDTSVRYNVTGLVVPKNRAVYPLVRRLGTLKPVLRRLLPFGARKRIKGQVFAEPPPLAPEVRRALREGYREDIVKLEGLIGRDLSGWLDGGGGNR
jgi:hypothetical protein